VGTGVDVGASVDVGRTVGTGVGANSWVRAPGKEQPVSVKTRTNPTSHHLC
jgi:hypothetical protein